MKTIEERTREYVQNANNIIELPARRYGCSVRQVSRAYIAGATEQKAIDIEKACEWLEENARDYACATIRCPYGEEEEIICDVHREIVDDFRKAMEE